MRDLTLTTLLRVLVSAEARRRFSAAWSPTSDRPAAAECTSSHAVPPAAAASTRRRPAVTTRRLRRAPPPPDDAGRDGGSMVGYIDDAIIESQVRVRFDVGLGQSTRPTARSSSTPSAAATRISTVTRGSHSSIPTRRVRGPACSTIWISGSSWSRASSPSAVGSRVRRAPGRGGSNRSTFVHPAHPAGGFADKTGSAISRAGAKLGLGSPTIP